MSREQKADIILSTMNPREVERYEGIFCNNCNGNCSTCIVEFTIKSVLNIFEDNRRKAEEELLCQ